jgi:hypothetical protein
MALFKKFDNKDHTEAIKELERHHSEYISNRVDASVMYGKSDP